MIQFDDSSSKSILQKPIVHARHAQQHAVTESEEEKKERDSDIELQQLNPPNKSGTTSPIIFEDPLLEKNKRKRMENIPSSDSSDSETSIQSSTECTDTQTSDSSNNEQPSKKIKYKEKMKKKPNNTKKSKKQTTSNGHKKKVQKKKTNNSNKTIILKTRKIFEKALKDLKKIK